jgi:hypothetical protein
VARLGDLMEAFTIPAPIGGMNNRDGEFDLEPQFATRLVNWIPGRGYLDARGPCLAASTNTVGSVIAGIYPHSSGNFIFSITNGDLYLVAGTIGAAIDTAGTNGDYHANVFGDRTVLCNGIDTPRVFDGTTVTAIVVSGTGLTASNLYGSITFKRRAIYWENGKRKFWYAAAGAYQGALSEFDLSTWTQSDGALVSIATLTNDGGEGPDDLCAFLFSNGEVLVYQGDDPGSTTAWSLVGRFRIGRMAGRSCWAQIGASTIVATENGAVDLGSALSSGALDDSAAIGPAFGAQNFSVTNSGERRLILDAKNKVLWLVLLEQPFLSFALNMLELHGIDLESRGWFTTSDIAARLGIGAGTATAICATPSGILLGATTSGRLVNGPARADTTSSLDYFTGSGILYESIQSGINIGDPARFKMLGSAAINIRRTVLSNPTESGTITIGSDRQPGSAQSVGTPSVRSRINVSAYGQRFTIATSITSQAGLRWYSTDLWAKQVGAR